MLRPDQVNLRGLHPLLRAEIQWGMHWHARRQHGKWELSPIQRLANYGRDRGLRSLTDLDPGDPGLREAAGRDGAGIAAAIAAGLHALYVTPEETREAGYILTEHFGRRLTDRSSRIDLDRISQRWLRDLVWDHFAEVLRSPSCPRTGGTFDHTRRAGLELSAFLEACAPGGGHDPRALTAGHMHKFAADQRQRELDGLASLGAKGVHGKPSIVTPHTRQAVFHRTRRLLRGALESGEAGRLGLDRGFITAMPAAGRVVQRSRPPFTDGVARALADEANLQALARDHDPFDRGLRGAWETIIVTGRRCSEVLGLRLDCLGRYGGLPMLWHDQTKVGNYDAAVRIPERTSQLLEARQRKTLDLFRERNNRPPTAGERAAMALFPTNFRNRDCQVALSYNWFHKGFKNWVDSLDIGRWVAHQARHSLATSLLRAGASLTHIRRYLGQVSEKMAEHYVHLAQSDLEDVLQQVWVAGPAPPALASCSPGRPPRCPASRPRPWRSTCRGAAPRPRAGSAPSSPSSREAPARGTWTATTATSSCCREPTCSTGGASASSGGSSPKAPPTTRPPTTCTPTSSRPPARSTASKRPSPAWASSVTRSPWTCASPRTTSTASGAPPSARPTSPPPATTSKTAGNRSKAREHRSGTGRPQARHRGRPRPRPRRDRQAPPGEDPGQRRRGQPAGGVSRTFLYGNPDARAAVADAIAAAGEQRTRILDAQDDEREATWRERALNAEDALKAAHREISTQRTRIGELLGQVRDLQSEWTEEAITRITTENATLKQRVRTLTAGNRTTEEKLKAARENLRFHDKRIADLEAQLAPPQ